MNVRSFLKLVEIRTKVASVIPFVIGTLYALYRFGAFDWRNGMLMLDASILPGKDPYQYPYDLPRVGVEGPPTCQGGLGDPATKVHAPFYVGNNAPQPYQPRTKPKANSQKLFQILFGEPPRG